MSIRLKTGLVAILIAMLSVVSVLATPTPVNASSNYSNNTAYEQLPFTTQFAITEQENNQQVEETPPQNFTSCERAIPGLGWIVCQVTRGVYDVFEWLIGDVISDNLLRVDVLENERGLREAWSGFLQVSNILFIIAFLAIIYAEASGRVGFLETYSATRVLPRMAFAAIMAQLSFVFVGFIIAVFNDLGDGIGGLILAPVEGFAAFDFRGLFYGMINDESWFGIPLVQEGAAVGAHALDNILAGIVLLGGFTGALIAFPVILSTLVLALATLVLVLVIRKALLVVFIVTAPVAFTAFILPGTEKLFRLWWDNLLRLLAMYPLVIGFIASGQLLARLVLAQEDITMTDSIIAMLAAFAPLFLIPATFRFAGSAIGGFVSGIQKRTDMQKDPRNPNGLMSKAKGRSQQRYDRVMTGEMKWGYGRFRTNKSILHPTIRRVWNRLGSTDVGAASRTALIENRKAIGDITSTGDDTVVRMSALASVASATEKIGYLDPDNNLKHDNYGWLKPDTNVARDEDGNILFDRQTGVAYKAGRHGGVARNLDGTPVKITHKDFVSKDVKSQVNKMRGDLGFFKASSEYNITKVNNLGDEIRALDGLNRSKWSAGERSMIRNGVWYAAKQNGGLHVKFMKMNTTDNPYKSGLPVRVNYDPTSTKQSLIDFDFKDMAGFVDQETNLYDLSQQKGRFWEHAVEGLKSSRPQDMTREEKLQVENLVWKAQNLINTFREGRIDQREIGERNNQMNPEQAEELLRMSASGSSAIGESARGAAEFLRTYASRIGYGPDQYDVIQPPEDHTKEIFSGR